MQQPSRLFEIPYYQLEKYPNEKMFVTKVDGNWHPTSTSDFLKEIKLMSKGLINLNIEPGDRIGLVSHNRIEWNIIDIATQQIGAILVPLYPNISESDYKYILNDAKVKFCFVGSEELAFKIKNIKNEIPSLIEIYSFDELENISHWKTIQKNSETIEDQEIENRKTAIKSEDLATIIYTSGTTGNPKGVMLSHSNLLSNVFACIEPIPADEYSRVLTFLPVCHVYERMLHYLYMYLGCSIHFAESMETIGENIREVKPHVFTAVPRLIEKVYDRIIAKGEELKGVKRKLFFWAVSIAEDYESTGKGLTYQLKLALARKLIFSKWKDALGGEVRAIASGSAALQPRLARIFLAAGIPILEGYGLTETSPVVTVNNFKNGIRIGSVGNLIDNVQVKIAVDGEILVKGPNVMMGYYNLPDETAEVINEDGWFCTGDIGRFENNYLIITDRKKEIFKTSGGKYIVPQMIENKLKASRYIEQVMVIGEGEKFPAAFLVPNFTAIKDWLTNNGYSANFSSNELINNEYLKGLFQGEVDQINKELGNWEQIKKFVILPKEFTVEGDELTPTLKLKRKKILAKYITEYKEIYN
jgi:long-chain acyl-CoA synthetase